MNDAPKENREAIITRGAPPWHSQTVPLCWPAGHAWCVGARPCALTPVRAFACLHVFPYSWCPGLPRTSTLLLNPPKMLSLLIKPEGAP